jgi:type II secretory pathway pseudopilin PulG
MRKFTDSSEFGFALKEILVVAVVLGGVGALIVPQFTNASVNTQDEQVKAEVRVVRAAVELYRAQHHDAAPDLSRGWTPLMSQSDADGGHAQSPLFGPYLPKPPVNPLTGRSTVASEPAAGIDWWWDSSTGTVTPLDANGVSYVQMQ